MKKALLLPIIVCFALMAKGQPAAYKPFKLDVSMGFDLPVYGNGTSGSTVVTIQPHYRISDNFSVGFRFEDAELSFWIDENTFLFGHITTAHGSVTSYCATGEYYFPNRVFIGGGLGSFRPGAIDTNTDPNGKAVLVFSKVSNLGFFKEIGFEAGHFRISADYNVAGSNSNYVAFHIGFFFWGVKKHPRN